MQWNLLLVDDELGILQAIRRMLRSELYTIYEASSAAEALEILQQHQIHLMVTDFKMPESDGLSLCRKVRQISPVTYRILLSGQVDYLELKQAWRDGDVHRFVAKPWDNLLLTSDIKEGLKQQQLLHKAELLRHGVQDEQPLLLTDANWVVRLANAPMCSMLNMEERELVGKNLFAPTISAMPVALETEVTIQVEANHSWLGFFNFLQSEQKKVPSWMAVTSVSEQFRICLCRFISEDIAQPTDFKDELQRYSGSHHLSRLEKDITQAGNNPELLIVTFDKQQLDNKDLSSICYERLQAATGDQYEIYSPQLNTFLILLPSSGESSQQQCDNIREDFEAPVSFRGERLKLSITTELEAKPNDGVHWNDWLRKRLGLLPESLDDQQPDQKGRKLSEAARPQEKHEHPVHLLFSQRGEVVSLMAPDVDNDTEQWTEWLEDVQSAWQQNFPGRLTLLFNGQDISQQQSRNFLNALRSHQARADIDAIFILSENQLLCQDDDDLALRADLHQAQCQLFMANFGRSFLNSRQVLSLPIQGVMLAPEFLANMRNSKSLPQSRRLLQRIHDHDLLIFAPEINSTEELAAAHQSNVDWISGDVLTRPLAADQIHWFAPG